MDKCSSKVHRVHMELGGKLFNSLRIETQFLERLFLVTPMIYQPLLPSPQPSLLPA